MKRLSELVKEAIAKSGSQNVIDYSASGRKITCWIANDVDFMKNVLPNVKADMQTITDMMSDKLNRVRLIYNFQRNTAKLEMPDPDSQANRMFGFLFKSSKKFDDLMAKGEDLKTSDLKLSSESGAGIPDDLGRSTYKRDMLEMAVNLLVEYFNHMPEPLF